MDQFAIKSLEGLYHCKIVVGDVPEEGVKAVTVAGQRTEDVADAVEAIMMVAAVGPDGAPVRLISGVPVLDDAYVQVVLA
jgi:hypothetical protein